MDLGKVLFFLLYKICCKKCQIWSQASKRYLDIDGILPKGPYAWQIGPFWQDTLDMWSPLDATLAGGIGDTFLMSAFCYIDLYQEYIWTLSYDIVQNSRDPFY